jgi:hypothetical protein
MPPDSACFYVQVSSLLLRRVRLYVVVEADPATNESQVLFPRTSMVQVHQTLESAERHRHWYIDHVYQEDPALGQQCVRLYRLQPVEPDLDLLSNFPSMRRA